MTRIQTLIILPLALLLGACDKDETDNAEPSDEAAPQADGERGGGPRGLARLDADNDGFISQAEAKDHRIADKFAELDADRDGKLSRDELHAMKGKHGKGKGWHGDKDPAERAAHFMAKFDADKDGALSQAELVGHPKLAERFAELDADKDGKLVAAELAAMKGRGGHHGKDGFHGKKDPAERAAHMLEKFDADKDGALSAAELAEHPKFAGKFAEVDSDRNGKLSREELTAYKAAHHGPRGDHGDRGPRADVQGEAHL
jgi:Ca2+-binding EF-hand superfamily protein